MLGPGIEQMARILEELSPGELEIFEFLFFLFPPFEGEENIGFSSKG